MQRRQGTRKIQRARKRVAMRDGSRCAICRLALHHSELTLDHVIPLANGGGNVDANYQLLCHRCHEDKDRAPGLGFRRRGGALLGDLPGFRRMVAELMR